MPSRHRRNNGRYPVERNPPGSYTSSVPATIMPRAIEKISCCYEKYVVFLKKQRYSTQKLFLIL